jgi:cytochrome c oxidase assembly factor CtaG
VAELVAPDPPSWRTLLFDWEPDLVLALVVAAGVLYGIGIRRLAARGRSWPRSRSIPFFGGLAVIVIATQSGIAAYDRVLFSMHMVQHLLLGMVAGLLLAFGAPVTLALQASSRSTQARLLRVVHSRPVRALTHPIAVWILFAGTLFVLYFTGLYELSLRNAWVHGAVHAHFLGVGFLFFALVVGVDPIAAGLGYGARMLFVAFMLPFHAFLGVVLLSADDVLGGGWYEQVARDWGASPLADQRTGAGLLWVVGEIVGVVTLIVVAARWMAHEERAAQRHDRRLDAEAGRAAEAPA